MELEAELRYASLALDVGAPPLTGRSHLLDLDRGDTHTLCGLRPWDEPVVARNPTCPDCQCHAQT